LTTIDHIKEKRTAPDKEKGDLLGGGMVESRPPYT